MAARVAKALEALEAVEEGEAALEATAEMVSENNRRRNMRAVGERASGTAWGY